MTTVDVNKFEAEFGVHYTSEDKQSRLSVVCDGRSRWFITLVKMFMGL